MSVIRNLYPKEDEFEALLDKILGELQVYLQYLPLDQAVNTDSDVVHNQVDATLMKAAQYQSTEVNNFSIDTTGLTPTIQFDAGDKLSYDRTANRFDFNIAGAPVPDFRITQGNVWINDNLDNVNPGNLTIGANSTGDIVLSRPITTTDTLRLKTTDAPGGGGSIPLYMKDSNFDTRLQVETTAVNGTAGILSTNPAHTVFAGVVAGSYQVYCNTCPGVVMNFDLANEHFSVSDSGTPAANDSVLLGVYSTTAGFRPPVMTTTQRDAIGTPATGLMIYNSTTNTVDVYDGTSWESLSYAV